MKSITKVLTLVIIASLATFTGCKSYDEDINSLNTNVTALKSQLANLQTYTKAEVDAKIATLTAEVAALKTSAATKAELSALESKVVTIAALNAYKTQVSTDIAAAVAGLATKASVDAVNVEVVKVQTALSALGVSVDEKILALKTELNAKDAELAIAIGAVTARVATLEGLVAPNTTGVADNKAAIVALQAELTALKNGTYTKAEIDAKLAALDADLKKLGTDLKLEFEVFAVRQLSGLLFVPEWVNDGFNAVEIGYIVDKATTPVKALFTQKDVIFRFNPTTADLSGTTWSFINNSAVFNAPGLSAAPGDASTLFAAPAFTNNNDGSGSFTLKVGTWSEPAAGKTHYFALQANKVVDGKTTSVVSDYVKVATTPYNAFISQLGVSPFTQWPSAKPAVNAAGGYELVYDGVVTPLPSIDLDNLVYATGGKGLIPTDLLETLKFGKLGTDYYFTFSIADAFLGLDGVTNQNSFVTLDNTTNVLTVKAGTASIDRNPLVTVQLKAKSNDKLLATAYIKFDIVRKATSQQQQTVTYNVAPVTFDYPELFTDNVAGIVGDGKEVVITWDKMNDNVYNPMQYTHNEYQADYHINPTAINVNGVAVSGATYTKYKDLLTTSTKAPNVDTYAMKYLVTPETKFGTTTVEYVWDPKVATPSSHEPIVKIKFTVNVNKPTLDKTILAGYRLNGSATDILTQGMNTGSNYLMQLYLGEAFSFGTSAYRDVFGAATVGKIDGATHNFAFKATTPAQTGAQLTPASATTINGALGTSAAPTTGQLMDLTVKLTTAERVYDMQFVTTYPNAETDVFDFKVHFVNPFSIELDPAADFQLIDKVNGTLDTQDLKANYIVKFKGKKIVTKGVAETTNSATTVVATDFVDITNAAYGLFYELTPGTEYFTISKAGGNAFNKQSVLTWDNVGTALQTEQTVATTKVKFVASFAEITRTADNVTVKPE